MKGSGLSVLVIYPFFTGANHEIRGGLISCFLTIPSLILLAEWMVETVDAYCKGSNLRPIELMDTHGF